MKQRNQDKSKGRKKKRQLGIMERKNTRRSCPLIYLSTLHNSAVHNIAFNGPASLPDKDMETAFNRQGWVNVPLTANRAVVLSEEGKVFCCANTLVTKTERGGDWFLNRVTSTATLRYVPIALTSVSCGTSKALHFLKAAPGVSDIRYLSRQLAQKQ